MAPAAAAARATTVAAPGAVGGVWGTLLLEAQDPEVNISWPYISACGGGASTSNGGTIKLFYDSFAASTIGQCGWSGLRRRVGRLGSTVGDARACRQKPVGVRLSGGADRETQKISM